MFQDGKGEGKEDQRRLWQGSKKVYKTRLLLSPGGNILSQTRNTANGLLFASCNWVHTYPPPRHGAEARTLTSEPKPYQSHEAEAEAKACIFRKP